jgi:membrane protein
MRIATALPGARFFVAAKEVMQEVQEDDVSGLSGELAYRLFLALIPSLIFLASVGAIVGDLLNVQDPTQQIMDSVGGRLPPDAASVLQSQVGATVQAAHPGVLSLSLLGALWAATGAMNALIKGLNRVYDVRETRPWYKRYPFAIGLTLAGALFVVGSFIIMVGIGVWGQQIADALGFGRVFEALLSILRWPLSFMLLVIAVGLLYRLAPNAKPQVKWVSVGAVIFAVTWLVAAFLFTLYVTNFGNYNNSYGALAGVILLLLWLYITSFVLLMGAQINSVIDPGTGEREGTSVSQGRDADQQPQQEGQRGTVS